MTTGPDGAAPTAADLIAAWAAAMADIREVVDRLGEEGWRTPSLLPGWSVGDLIAHLAWLERILLDRHDPPHHPDWVALPHVSSDFGRATEVPVDLRRSWPRSQVLAEFDQTIADRHAALAAGPQELSAAAVNAFGRPATLESVLRMRIFDTWVHGQDARLAVGQPGATDTAAARVAAQQIAGALGFLWAKRVDAPTGSSLVVDVTPPGVAMVRAVQRGTDGRGIDIVPPSDPTVTLALSFDDFVQLGCGRTRPDSTIVQARARVAICGDRELGERTVAALNIAP